MLFYIVLCVFVFFKQKTAYEMRISDWSSDGALPISYDDQVTAQERLVDAYKVSYQLSELRYRSGVASYLDALVAQRSLYTAQQTLITTRLDRAGSLVTLYKVLGGGLKETAGSSDSAMKP